MRSPSTRDCDLDSHDLGALGQALGFAVLILDGDGRVRDARGDAERVLGRSMARVRGRALASFIARTDRHLLEECLDGRTNEFVPLKLAGPRQASRWIELRAARLTKSSAARGVLIATHDVTDRRTGEQALLASLKRQRANWSERLAEDLAQRATGAAYKLHALLAERASFPGTGSLANAAIGELGSVVRDMRSLACEIDPVSDRSGGLRSALRQLVRRLDTQMRSDASIALDASGWRHARLAADLALCWHDLLEELISEACGDPAVKRVRVILQREQGALAARIESVKSGRQSRASGSRPGMSEVARERVRLLGGTVRRESRRGRFATVVTAPR